MSDRLHMIVADMADYLDAGALKTIILNAIPEHQEREFYPTDPPRRPGLPHSGSRGRAFRSLAHEDAYCAEFPDDEALEYIDLIREVVLAQDPPKNAETRAFLLEEYATYSTKTQGVPRDFQPILILFKKWCDLTAGNPDASDTGANPPTMAAMRAMLHVL